MKPNQSRKKSKRQVTTKSAVVDFVSFKQTRLKAQHGTINVFAEEDSRNDLKLLPGDRVEYQEIQFGRENRTAARAFSVHRKAHYQVVMRVPAKVAVTNRTPHLIPVGLPHIQPISMNAEKLPGKPGTHVLVTVSRQSGAKRNSVIWNIKHINRILNNQLEIADAVALTRFGIDEKWKTSIKSDCDSFNTRSIKLDKFREDLRELPFVTIDPATAKDHDDAIYCETLGKNKFLLMVAIADVSEYVVPQSSIDKEAFFRGATIYLSDRSVPMIPEVLSSDLCSLVPEEDRLAIVCKMTVSNDGDIDSYQFVEAVIRSHAKLKYEEVLPDDSTTQHTPKVSENLKNLFNLHQVLLDARDSRKALVLDIPEARLIFNDNKTVEKISIVERLKSHSLVEEMMLAANICAAGFINEHYPNGSMFRVHDVPPDDKATVLGELLDSLGIFLNMGSSITAEEYSHIFDQVRDDDDLLFALQFQLLRSLSLAVYSKQKGIHFALNYPIYTHFTSPIRRYPDLVVHRLIKSRLRKTGYDMSTCDFEHIANRCSYLERRAESCEREAKRRLIVNYVQTRIGEVFQGVVIDVKNFGLFVQLDSPYCDGLVAVEDLGYEYFQYNKHANQLVGTTTGMAFGIGMRISVSVSEADHENGRISFKLADEYEPMPHRKKRKKQRRRR